MSVLIPVRNGMPHLRTALATAKHQIGVDLELIVLDDCSTDDSAAVAWDAGATVLSANEPLGAGRARARLFGAAQGEWVQFLDADDWLPAEKIVTQLGVGGDASFCDFVMVHEGGGSRRISLAQADFWAMLLKDGSCPQTGCWLLHRRRLFGRGWRPDERYPAATDGKLLLDLLVAGADLRYCPDTQTYYRRYWHPSQLSSQRSTKVWRDEIRREAQALNGR